MGLCIGQSQLVHIRISYFSVTQFEALVSFGNLAVLGEFTCLVTALLFLPAILMLRKEGQRKTKLVMTPTTKQESQGTAGDLVGTRVFP